MTQDSLSVTLSALADPTRRAILARLAKGESSVTELAEPFQMSLPAVSKHLKVLEHAGLISRGREAQWRPCRLEAAPMREVASFLDDYKQFWAASLDRLTDYIAQLRDKEKAMTDLKIVAPPGENYMVLTRTFDAPIALVWRAVSDPEHIIRWWGPHGYENRVLEFDWRVGGKWRIETIARGQSTIFHGEYREIEAPWKTVQTFGIEGMYGDMFSVDTLTLEEIDGRTHYKVVSVLPNVEARDGMMASGMEKGVVEGFERLDQILEDFKAGL